jgi:hypothetical protein
MLWALSELATQPGGLGPFAQQLKGDLEGVIGFSGHTTLGHNAPRTRPAGGLGRGMSTSPTRSPGGPGKDRRHNRREASEFGGAEGFSERRERGGPAQDAEGFAGRRDGHSDRGASTQDAPGGGWTRREASGLPQAGRQGGGGGWVPAAVPEDAGADGDGEWVATRGRGRGTTVLRRGLRAWVAGRGARGYLTST